MGDILFKLSYPGSCVLQKFSVVRELSKRLIFLLPLMNSPLILIAESIDHREIKGTPLLDVSNILSLECVSSSLSLAQQ